MSDRSDQSADRRLAQHERGRPTCPAELAAVLEAARLVCAEVQPVSDARRTRPTTFRLVCTNGRVLKAQILPDAEGAARVEHLRGLLDVPELPRFVARAERALLSEWIEGQPLTAASITRDQLRACGALLARVHRVPLPAEDRTRPANRVLARDAKLREDLARLVEAQRLGPDEAQCALDYAAAHKPVHFSIGIEHGDFCAANLVLDASGTVWSVDNETLRIDAHDHDLGRTWYRWPLQRAEREAFFAGYAHHRPPDSFFAHFPYWAITATVGGAAFRLRQWTAGAEVSVKRLRELLRALQSGASLEAAAFDV
ncbi:MAG TPA: aminoglycoside phosphotransferase family protein [Candidatus Acidoferrales bacterium]|nr:aminoglycoside phosphotransferase family protein [Candidatus Acidoferrales bacterium]